MSNLSKDHVVADRKTDWGLSRDSINHIQQRSIQRLVERAKHAHMVDVKVRINGQDEWYEVDWLKHLKEIP